MKLHHLMAASLALACMYAAALAETATGPGVSIPVGEWVPTVGEWLVPLIGAAALWLIRKLPSQIAGILMTMRADQLLEKAVAYALNAVEGAAKGKQLTFHTGSEVVDNALQYVVTNGPGWLINWLGGETAIRQKIIARLDIAPDVGLK